MKDPSSLELLPTLHWESPIAGTTGNHHSARHRLRTVSEADGQLSVDDAESSDSTRADNSRPELLSLYNRPRREVSAGEPRGEPQIILDP